MQTLFVYYKLPVGQRVALRTRVEDFHQRLRQSWPGLEVELMQRPEPSADGMETWMEVYRHPEGVSEKIIAASAQLAIEMDLPPKRAVEVFIALRN